MREATTRGERLGLPGDELAFYDALETNDSAGEHVTLEMTEDTGGATGTEANRQR